MSGNGVQDVDKSSQQEDNEGMTNYIITNEAIDEAAEAIRVGIDRRSIWSLAKAALEAGAPFLRAQALEEAAEALRQAREDIDPWGKPTVENYADWIDARAATEMAS